MDIGIGINLLDSGISGLNGPVTPADLANLFAWYKADGALFSDDLGVDAVVPPSSPVGFMTDESGNGYDLKQATTAAKPTWDSATPNLTYDGGDILAADIFTSPITGSWTVCYVANRPIAVNNDRLFGMTNSTTNNISLDHSPAIGGTKCLFNAGGSSFGGTFLDMNMAVGDVPDIFFFTINPVLSSVSMWNFTGGVLVASSQNPIGGAAVSWSIDRMALGGFVLGTGVTPSWEGGIREVFVVSDIMTEEDMESQGAALAVKWGVV